MEKLKRLSQILTRAVRVTWRPVDKTVLDHNKKVVEKATLNMSLQVVVDEKERLLKPILSRLCNIFIDTNTNNNNIFKYESLHASTNKFIKNELSKFSKTKSDLFILTDRFYNKGVTALHLIDFIKNKQQRYI